MSERPTQAPEPQQYNPNGYGIEQPVRPIDTPLQDAHDQEWVNPVPSTVPHDIEDPTHGLPRYNPNAIPSNNTQESKKFFTKKNKLILGGVGISVIAAGIATLATNDIDGSPDKTTSRTVTGGDTVGDTLYEQNTVEIEVPEQELDSKDLYKYDEGITKGVDAMQPYDFLTSVSTADILDYNSEIISDNIESAHTELNAQLKKFGYPTIPELAVPSVTNTPQQILDRHNVLDYLATTLPDKERAMKLLGSYNSPSANGIETTFGKIEDDTKIISKHNAVDATNVFYNDTLYEIEAAGNPTIGIEVIGATNDNARTQAIFQFRTNHDGENGEWIRIESKKFGNEDWIYGISKTVYN